MKVREITVKSALVRSRIPGIPWVINPYRGCSHGCRYCYAVFMKKYSPLGENQPWGEFVEVKKNIPEVLENELARKRKSDTVLLSSVCDPYQPLEKKYRLTRTCLKSLRAYGWEIRILTKSPLILRDLDILAYSLNARVGISVPTEDEEVRKTVEPNAPSIPNRIETLHKLRQAGIRTWAFIAPVLPLDPQHLHHILSPLVDYVMIDALNYRSQVSDLFRKMGWDHALTREYAAAIRQKLRKLFGKQMKVY